ncbi:hypothetical protein BKA00_005584 [Actinomadura coerulea]|uniref:Uncharacterized protein n=1 Tax=Actinomadura coerulea TaxID=46159 RepID=A0A7X0L1L6_9ACTN|nr:hypothetical protein [Actinomadura coerulea]MBB6398670.1 hypothetical protein [Actinomadura coerulea]GGQ00186.1 hypothetical protein GCM10010187_14930 [Actinomadura coerulea]
MNLSEAKREYREVLEAFAGLDEVVSEAGLADVQRRGMVTKLDRMHQEAHAGVLAIASGRRGG